MGIRWSTTPSRAWGDLANAYTLAIRRGVRAIAARYAAEIEAYMKANAVWQDQTGNARQSLSAEVEDITRDMVQIILAHGVDYGQYLELSHGGSYQILAPTIDVFAPRIWADVVALLR